MTDAAHTATLSVTYDSTASADAVERSIRPEVGALDEDRSTTRVVCEGATVEFHVTAADLVALRASTNTWVRLVETAEDVAAIAHRDESGPARR